MYEADLSISISAPHIYLCSANNVNTNIFNSDREPKLRGYILF